MAGSLDDTGISLKAMSSRAETHPLAKIEREKLLSKMYELVGDDQDLRDLIAAADLTDGKPQGEPATRGGNGQNAAGSCQFKTKANER